MADTAAISDQRPHTSHHTGHKKLFKCEYEISTRLSLVLYFIFAAHSVFPKQNGKLWFVKKHPSIASFCKK